MNKFRLLLLLVICISSLQAQPIITRFSYAEFSIGTIAFGKVEGTLSYVSGEIQFNEQDLSNSYFRVSIPAESIFTDQENRDKHLKNEDFLDVANHPNITFTSDTVFLEGSTYVARGSLTIRGVSNTVDIVFTSENKGLFKHLTGNLSIERLDYNVGVGQKKALVKPTIDIVIHCAIVKT